MLDWLPFMQRDLGGFTPAARFRKAVATVDELLYAEIAPPGAATAAERDDVLTLLLAARHEDGSPMSDVELRDELMTLLTAGHETTATALSWAFDRLLRTPRVLERLLGSLDDDEYLDAVVKETLRVRPVIVDVARKLTRDTEIAGWQLPAGTLVLPAIAAMHARPTCTRRPSTSGPSASSRTAPSRTPGSRSAAGCGAASGRRSRSSRCGSCCARCCAGSRARRLTAARAPAGAPRDRRARARLPRGGRGAAGATAAEPRSVLRRVGAALIAGRRESIR